MKKGISIIVPAFNAERTIVRCIESVIKNNTGKIELIVIDDGSQDATKRICNEYKNKYDFIRIISQKNLGVSSARNRGIDEAKFDKLLFIDADDYILEDYIAMFEMYNDDFVMSGFMYSNEKQELKEEKCMVFDGSVREFAKQVKKWINPPFLLSPWAKLFKTEIVRKNNLKYREEMSYGEDVAFVFEYLKHVLSVRVIENCGYCYSICNTLTLSNKFNEKMFHSCVVGIKLMSEFLKKNDVNDLNFLNERIRHDFTSYTRKLILSNLSIKKKKEIFFSTSIKYNIKDLYFKSNSDLVSEKIVKIVLKYNVLFPILYSFKIRERM